LSLTLGYVWIGSQSAKSLQESLYLFSFHILLQVWLIKLFSSAYNTTPFAALGGQTMCCGYGVPQQHSGELRRQAKQTLRPWSKKNMPY